MIRPIGWHYAGKPVFAEGNIYYYAGSRHRSRAVALVAVLRMDYPKDAKVRKYKGYYYRLIKLKPELQKKLTEKGA